MNNCTWSFGISKNQSTIGSSNVGFGRKILEKMGWSCGVGLGKDNQGMIENPLWRNRRNPQIKTGFKCKDETLSEILVHQNAFEDLLTELNSQTEDCVDSNSPTQTHEKKQTSKRCVRYTKMARAKDIRNYSVKDFEGIIGKHVTEKHLILLQNNGCDRTMNIKEENYQNCEQKNTTVYHKTRYQFQLPENSTTLIENSSCSYSQQEHTAQDSEIRKKKRKHHKSQISSVNDSNSICDNASTSVNVDAENPYVCFKKLKKRTKKEKSKSSGTINSSSSISQRHTNIYTDCINSKEHSCSTTSIVYHKENDAHNIIDVSKNFVPQFGIDVKNMGKSCFSNITKEHRKGANSLVNTNGYSNGIKFDNSYMCTSEFRNKDNFTNHKNNFITDASLESKVQMMQNPEILAQISDAFQGSNVKDIKGYGNW